VSQRRTFRSCGYKWLFNYLQGWRSRQTRAVMVLGSVMEQIASAIACGWVTTADDAEAGFLLAWDMLDRSTVEWSVRNTWEAFRDQGAALSRIIVPQIQERIFVPEVLGQQYMQERIFHFLAPGVREQCIPDLYGFVRQDLFSDYRLTVLDFKTKDRGFDDSAIELDEQMVAYQLAEESKTRMVQQLCLCVMIRGANPKMQWLFADPRPTLLVERHLQSATLIDAQIKRGEFWQNPNECFNMGECEFLSLCYPSRAHERDAKLIRNGDRRASLFTGWDD